MEHPGTSVAIGRDVAHLIEIDDIDGVVGDMGDVQPAKLAVDGGMIEAALTTMLGKLDVALESERHGSAGADPVLRPGVQRIVDRQLELELALVVDVEEGKTIGDRKESRGLGCRIAIL
jgi:hypothetical protein